MKYSMFVLLGALLPVVAMTASATDRWKDVEASMVVTGTITVNPDGSVKTYTVHDLDKLPPSARGILQATIPEWEFFPVKAKGKPVAAKGGMSVRIVADMVDEKHAKIRVASAEFGCDAYSAKSPLPNVCPPNATVWYGERKPPRYPVDALWVGGEGMVYLLVEIGRDGNVIHAAARQVNLYHRTRRDPTVVREALAKSARTAALKWKFRVPTVGPEASRDHWVVQVPINYTINRSRASNHEYGHWNAYIPGPVQDIPWYNDESAGSKGSADAIAAGALFVRDTRFVLKTRLGDNGDHS